jgi:hypothetical protein
MHTVVAINVDYVATGAGHLDRAICRVSLATGGAVVLDLVVRVPNLRDAMSVYTGLVAADFDAPDAVDLACAVERTRGALAAFTSVLLVGHGLARCARGMQLLAGRDYHASVDVIELLRTWNRRFGHWNYYALPKICHVASVALPRNSSERAAAMLLVYEHLVCGPFATSAAKERLQQLQYSRGFPESVSRKPDPPDGVCVWAYRADLCTCGQAILGAARSEPQAEVRGVAFQ